MFRPPAPTAPGSATRCLRRPSLPTVTLRRATSREMRPSWARLWIECLGYPPVHARPIRRQAHRKVTVAKGHHGLEEGGATGLPLQHPPRVSATCRWPAAGGRILLAAAGGRGFTHAITRFRDPIQNRVRCTGTYPTNDPRDYRLSSVRYFARTAFRQWNPAVLSSCGRLTDRLGKFARRRSAKPCIGLGCQRHTGAPQHGRGCPACRRGIFHDSRDRPDHRPRFGPLRRRGAGGRTFRADQKGVRGPTVSEPRDLIALQ